MKSFARLITCARTAASVRRTSSSKKMRLTAVNPARFFTQVNTTKLPFKHNPAEYATEITISAIPAAGETRQAFKLRAEKEIPTTFKSYPNHMLIMSYATRLARSDEKIANVSHLFDKKHQPVVDLPFMDQPIFTGHCSMKFIDAKGQINHDHTFSLRPDMSKPIVYKAVTAPDTRLPSTMLDENTRVHHAKHTTLQEEIGNWANNAFYARHVHTNRPNYLLHCILKPVARNEEQRYLEAINEVKLMCQRYSLLDHLHPYTGVTSGDIVEAQNCTSITKIIEKSNSINLKKLLGDNPTPQTVIETIKKLYFKCENSEVRNTGELIEALDDDTLNKTFIRKIS